MWPLRTPSNADNHNETNCHYRRWLILYTRVPCCTSKGGYCAYLLLNFQERPCLNERKRIANLLSHLDCSPITNNVYETPNSEALSGMNRIIINQMNLRTPDVLPRVDMREKSCARTLLAKLRRGIKLIGWMNRIDRNCEWIEWMKLRMTEGIVLIKIVESRNCEWNREWIEWLKLWMIEWIGLIENER